MFLRRLLVTIAAYVTLLQNLIGHASAQDDTTLPSFAALTDEQVNASYTSVTGFEQCNRDQQVAIIQAFWDATSVLNLPFIRSWAREDKGINWNAPPAIEFLGSPFSRDTQDTLQGSWFVVSSFAFLVEKTTDI